MVDTTKAYEIKKYILNGHDKETSTVLAKKFNTTRGYVKNLRNELRKGNLSAPKKKNGLSPLSIDNELVERRRQEVLKDYQRRNQELLYKYNELDKKFGDLLQLTQDTVVDIPKIKIDPRVSSQAVPIIQFSDWHVEEKIERGTTGGLNEFTPDIAKKRTENLAINTLKLIRKERQDTKIDSLVICLGGDFINNYLHDHDVQMNFMSPIEATMYAKELLKKTLLTIAENAQVKKIVLLCIRGNHGRLTKRMQSSNDYKMNHEAMLFHILKQELSDNLFEWYIPESELGYIEVLGKKIRAFHGHQVNYQGGIGGLTIPLTKSIMRWDRTNKADFSLMHHYHQLSSPMSTCSLNGSLCGWNSYALSIGAPYEPAMQSFQLLDSKRGFTVRVPIFCE